MTKKILSKNKTDCHAKLIIYDLPTMKSVTYRRLVDWLMQTAKEFKKEKDTKIFSKKYTSKLMK